MTELKEFLPFWDKLAPAEQEQLSRAAARRSVPGGTVLYNGDEDCLGLVLVETGQLRAYITSDDGREVTIYRLFDRDVCLLSASCMIRNIGFRVTIAAEKESTFRIIPAGMYKWLIETSHPAAVWANELMASRFTDVMWLMEQVMWKSMDHRLAVFLLEESAIEGTDCLKITHEKIAAHLGTAREVVSRLLKYFQSDGAVALSRGTIRLTNPKKLNQY